MNRDQFSFGGPNNNQNTDDDYDDHDALRHLAILSSTNSASHSAKSSPRASHSPTRLIEADDHNSSNLLIGNKSTSDARLNGSHRHKPITCDVEEDKRTKHLYDPKSSAPAKKEEEGFTKVGGKSNQTAVEKTTANSSNHLSLPPPPPCSRKFRPLERPLSRREVERSLPSFGLYSSVHRPAFISEENDAGDVLHGSGRKPPKIPLIKDEFPDDEEAVDDSFGLSHFRRLAEAESDPKRKPSSGTGRGRDASWRLKFVPCIKPPSRYRVVDWGIEHGMLKNKSEERKGFPKGSTGVPKVEEKEENSDDIEGSVRPDASSNVTKENSQNVHVSGSFASGTLVQSGGSSQPPCDLASETLPSQPPDGFSSSSAFGGGDNSAIEGPTLIGGHGFKCGQETALGEVKAVHEASHVTAMSLEVHCVTRGELFPDPEFDAIAAVFFSLKTDSPSFTIPATEPDSQGWILVAQPDSLIEYHEKSIRRHFDCGSQFRSIAVPTEENLFDALEFLVQAWDPDILVGWDIEMFSWGYVMQRGTYLNRNLQSSLSRVTFYLEAKQEKRRHNLRLDQSLPPDGRGESLKAGQSHPEPINLSTDWQNYHTVPGRIVLCGWRTIKYSLTLNNYTFENAVYHVLHERIPRYQFDTLTAFFLSQSIELETLVFGYYLTRAMGNLRLLLQLDLISSTSEMARVFGIMFHDVLTRGSQFRVESMMFRFAKPRNFVLVSPSIEQRALARAPVVIPLNLEPESKFYTDPVIVLDFQSLYPSIMIAYNYCYSTCLGRVEQLGTDDEFAFGATRLRIPRQDLDEVKHDINVSPCGVAFLNATQRNGVLPKMLSSILSTRIMVKQAMKKYKSDATLSKVLDYRQMGLKLIANVTFGYTAANYSGRMPLVELGDSIVAKSRETLERSIDVVEKTPRWDAQVIYGDTDSMFVLLKGRSTEEAFKIGEEIVEVVTKMYPSPITLKLEKCYESCVLMTKKRYCGYMRESPTQELVFEGKGIETVRRDGCAVVSKVLESALKILFRTKDVSLVKNYVQRQMAKTIDGRTPMQDLIIAKEYRGRGGYRPGACVASLEIARKATRVDRRAEPRSGERVPYVIVNGPPGLQLIKMVRTPLEILRDPNLSINSSYYITKQIVPALSRVFHLLGVNVASWFDQVYQGNQHHPKHARSMTSIQGDRAPMTISQFFSSSHCLVCSSKTSPGRKVCAECALDPQRVVLSLQTALRDSQRKCQDLANVCHGCSGWNPIQDRNSLYGVGGRQICLSFDCPVVFRLGSAAAELAGLFDTVSTVVNDYED